MILHLSEKLSSIFYKKVGEFDSCIFLIRMDCRKSSKAPVTGRPTKSLLVPGPDSPLRKRRITLAEAGIPQEEIMVLYSLKSRMPYLARVQERNPMYKGWKQKKTPRRLLLKSGTHDPDRTVLPSDQELTDTVKSSAADTLATRISNRLNKHE